MALIWAIKEVTEMMAVRRLWSGILNTPQETASQFVNYVFDATMQRLETNPPDFKPIIERMAENPPDFTPLLKKGLGGLTAQIKNDPELRGQVFEFIQASGLALYETFSEAAIKEGKKATKAIAREIDKAIPVPKQYRWLYKFGERMGVIPQDMAEVVPDQTQGKSKLSKL